MDYEGQNLAGCHYPSRQRSRVSGSNGPPTLYKSVALPYELTRRETERIRGAPYPPEERFPNSLSQCARRDSNPQLLGPRPSLSASWSTSTGSISIADDNHVRVIKSNLQALCARFPTPVNQRILHEPPVRIELTAFPLRGGCSARLSYRGIKPRWNRTTQVKP